ncbi:MAG: MBL fold metallo-hydrolase [Microthrixaceae bacterium]
MLDPLRHTASLARWAATRRSQERAGTEALSETRWTDAQAAAELPDGLSIRWLGTAGYELTYRGYVLLIDPYLTRMPVADLLRRRTVPPNAEAVAAAVSGADAVLVGHTHFDHALDVPEIVRRFGCPAYGSPSVQSLLGLYGLATHAVDVQPYLPYELGPFTVTFVPSQHSKLGLGMFVPQSGPITCDALDALCPQAYRCDQVWGIHLDLDGFTLYHQGSAELVDDAVCHHDVDVFLCGVAGRQFSERFVERVLRRLEPRLVVPGHYDDFFRPLDATAGFTANVDLAGFVEEVAAVSADFTIRSLALGQRVDGDPPA